MHPIAFKNGGSALEKDTDMDIIVIGAAIAALVILLLWRLSSGAYGRLSPSNDVTLSYQSYQVDPDSNYYISGPDDFPHAVLGINKSVTLDSDLWKVFDAKPERMKSLVENMSLLAAQKIQSLQGYDILDDRGRKIGNLFSPLGVDVMIKASKEGSIIITTPSPPTHLQSDR
jgi:hypothetical protein